MTELHNLIRSKTPAIFLLPLLAVLASTLVAQDDRKDSDTPEIEFLHCEVLVVDPDGNPVQDATVYCTGMRSRVEPGSSYGWTTSIHGPLSKLKTGDDGIVRMPCPKFVNEKLETGKVRWTVEHPDFVSFGDEYSVDDELAKITLARGFRIAVTAVNGESGEKVKNDLYAVIGGSREDWKLANNGMLVSPVFARKNTTMRVCQIVEGQPILFSESIKIEPGDRSRLLLKDVKLLRGTRVEGKLDESIDHPIKNGHVAVSIERSMEPDERSTRWVWADKAPINEDGTFVFESLPPGEVLQMIPVCDGWVPANPNITMLLKHFPDEIEWLARTDRSLPQLAELEGEKVTPTLRMKKATSVRVTVLGPDGEPLHGAEVRMGPNQLWFNGGSSLLGTAYSQAEVLVKSRTGTFEYNRQIRYKVRTDESGIAVIHSLPSGGTQEIAAYHDEYDTPINAGERVLTIDLKPNAVAEVTIKMQKKGVDALGEQGNEGDNDQ